jgi:hypothetical protein
MKTTMRIVTAALVTAVLASPAAWAGDQKDAADYDKNKSKDAAASPSTAPARIEGEVTAVDPEAGTMTVRMSDGTTQEFRGNRETLKDYKVGDRIEGKRRK